MTPSTLRAALLGLAPALGLCALDATDSALQEDPPTPEARAAEEEKVVQIQYLEIVTPEVEATCDTLAKLHGVEFGDPVPGFGNARTAPLEGGGLIGVRAPMRADEEPVVRPYVLVDDIEAAAEAAKAAGGEIAIPPMEIPDRGRFSIYIHGGIQHGLWQD